MRVELGDGTGHGTRITLTVTGTDPAEIDAARDQWGTGAVGHLAAMAAEWAQSPAGVAATADGAPGVARQPVGSHGPADRVTAERAAARCRGRARVASQPSTATAA